MQSQDDRSLPQAVLPTTFVEEDEGQQLEAMLELELDQARQVSGGLASAVRCCACHCCSCHC